MDKQHEHLQREEEDVQVHEDEEEVLHEVVVNEEGQGKPEESGVVRRDLLQIPLASTKRIGTTRWNKITFLETDNPLTSRFPSLPSVCL
jgi:hypothetical protein